jgi:Cof subfamily protein (haloacid dehalogenase superfamily)
MKNARVRLIALDLDGTLLDREGDVSDGNAAAIKDALAAGVHIVIATSRWYLLAKRTADILGIRSPVICHNGAMIRDPIDGARIMQLDVPADAAVEIAALADERRYESMATVDEVTYLLSKVPNIPAARLPEGMVQTARLGDHVREGAEAFLFFGKDATEGFRAHVGDRYAGVLNMAYGYSQTFPHYLNITHAAADKGRALAIVAEHLGVSIAETMAIGDAAPDLEMMRAAGIGMAMGNAPDEVKEHADVVGPGNAEDGVAWAVREFAL